MIGSLLSAIRQNGSEDDSAGVGDGGGEDDGAAEEHQEESDENAAGSPSNVDATVEYDPGQRPLADVASTHQSIVSPSSIEERANAVRTGEYWTKTL
ncbi:hypothetical protein [Natronoarchaeum rubrum]|uniref:hypothetical protein n=1 Tax=Natronoarchaeum rubrum TaxID=755311 RepID=UPI0035BFE82C